ncbi:MULTISPECIES: hypothetical protein [Planktothrix]|uniref:Uncharacterized protein n=1 Tax=Planktothrix mougeotii LEGE 06226 TaxID=1828728 RepID=A0ABR9U5E0_9CYAN|nr:MULTISPECIES: hypothetical protein [Planktothrix]MBD2485792.1 hypothetical protein [Planktothrix sp. FACHB-1365]MBE9141669.1 hypothetical protein [Planktothrix mougeotii LEGE 06226]
MLNLNSSFMLESTLTKLLNKTEKTWGYLQIYQRGEFYYLSIPGHGEDILKFKGNDSTYSYQLYWYKRPNPSVFVEAKTQKTYRKETKTYDKAKSFQVCFKREANSIESAINRLFAELVKTKISEEYTGKDSPIITLVQD